MAEVNYQYKDRLFNFIFGREENRSWTLSLYNAVNKSNHKNPEEIYINTIRDTLYLGMHNDVSFIIGSEMSLYEQQSTFCPNMPVRLLQYAGNLFEKYIEENHLNKYGQKIIPLPVPKLVVFYNGSAEQDDEITLKLRDSFPEGADPDIEARVRMVNINYGRNKELLDGCRPLKEYSWLVQKIRDYRKEKVDLETAADRAIMEMPDDYEIKPFLAAHRAEVKGMLLTEYDEAKAMNRFYEDGRTEGRAEGITGVVDILRSDGKTDSEIIERIESRFGLTQEQAEGYVLPPVTV